MGIGVVNTCVTTFPFGISYVIQFFNNLTSLPSILVPLSVIFIYFFGIIGLVVPLLIIIFLVVMFFVSKYNSSISTKANTQISMLNQGVDQFVSGIKHIKFNGWE